MLLNLKFYKLQMYSSEYKYLYQNLLLFVVQKIIVIPRYNIILSWLPISLVKDKKRMRRHVVTGYIPALTHSTLENQLSLFYFMGNETLRARLFIQTTCNHRRNVHFSKWNDKMIERIHTNWSKMYCNTLNSFLKI